MVVKESSSMVRMNNKRVWLSFSPKTMKNRNSKQLYQPNQRNNRLHKPLYTRHGKVENQRKQGKRASTRTRGDSSLMATSSLWEMSTMVNGVFLKIPGKSNCTWSGKVLMAKPLSKGRNPVISNAPNGAGILWSIGILYRLPSNMIHQAKTQFRHLREHW